MARLLVIVGLALTVAQAAGASLMLGAHQCQERCADDLDDGQCAPGCHDCNCCAGIRVVTSREQVAAAPDEPGHALRVRPDAILISAEPHEILHVPKLLLV